MAFLKPQSPLSQGNDYFYPLTTADQVIMKGGYRLDQIVGAVKKSTITLYANGWSAEVPYSYSVTVEGLDDNVNMKMLPHFPEDFEGMQAMKEETAKISFASRSGNILTFECWDEVPTIDIPVDIEIDITYPGVPDIKMNYSVVGGIEEPANPIENMIWVNTDQEITDYKLSKYEPKNPIEGMVWICLDNTSNVYFYTLNINGKEFNEVYPLFAKQYVNNAWVDVEAMSYQNGEWKTWTIYLYKNGDECTAITGGWSLSQNYSGTHGDSLTKNEDSMVFSTSFVMNVNNAFGFLRANNKIDLTEKNMIVIDFKSPASIAGPPLYLCIKETDTAVNNMRAYTQIHNGDVKVYLDISLYDGEYYVGIAAGNAEGSSSVAVEQVIIS